MVFFFDKEVKKELDKQAQKSTIQTMLTYGFFTTVINNILSRAFGSSIIKPVAKREFNHFLGAYKNRAKLETRLFKKDVKEIASYAYRFALGRNFYRTAMKKGYEYIVWERTISIKPRHEHLMMVGQKIQLTEARISSGRLPGLAWGCKCGATLIKKVKEGS